MSAKQERYNEWKPSANDSNPCNGFALFATEQSLRLRSGKKHEHQQANPVEKVQSRLGQCRICAGVHAQKRRADEEASQDFSNHARLAQSAEQTAEQMGRCKNSEDK